MASTTTSPEIVSTGLIKIDTLDFITTQGAECHFPPGMVVSARMLFGQIKNPGVFSHGGKRLMAAVCLCVVARFAHQLFSLNDLAKAASTDRGAINHLAHRLQKVLGIRRPPADLRLLVPQICERLNLPENTQEAAYLLASRLQAHLPSNLQGRMPSAVAAAVVCAAGDATKRYVTFTASAHAAHIAITATIAARKALAQLNEHRPPS